MNEIKELTIKELKYKIKELEDEIDMYLTLKKIDFVKTQPGAMTYKEVIVQGGQPYDKFTHYTIKSEKYDKKIIDITDTLLTYQKRLNNKIANISNSDSKTFITYLREKDKIEVTLCARVSRSGVECGRQRNKNLVFKILKESVDELFLKEFEYNFDTSSKANETQCLWQVNNY